MTLPPPPPDNLNILLLMDPDDAPIANKAFLYLNLLKWRGRKSLW